MDLNALRIFARVADLASFTLAAEQLGLSMPALKSAVHRLRRRMAELVREEIRGTVQSPDDVEAELHALFAALRG